MNASARGTDAACARTASAMFVHPARRHNASSPLRNAANACGARGPARAHVIAVFAQRHIPAHNATGF
jgi:hypothetical protein